MRLDHVLYAAGDLDGESARFARDFGLSSYAGGNHPLFGTGNRIIPLGDSYIELIAVSDEAVAAHNPLGRLVGSIAQAGGGWLGWVAAVDDVDQHAARIGAEVVAGHRIRPDGVTVSWRAAGMERMLEDQTYPFFITWDDPAAHPGRTGEASPSTTIELAADETALRAWLGGSPPPWLRLVGRAGGLRRVLIDGRPIP